MGSTGCERKAVSVRNRDTLILVPEHQRQYGRKLAEMSVTEGNQRGVVNKRILSGGASTMKRHLIRKDRH